MTWLLGRAVFAFLLMPGLVAFVVPWLLLDGRVSGRAFNPLGLVLLTLGTALLLWCVALFYSEGRGTLAPWDPPRALVTSGVYRLSRNPMYVAVALVLWGWALAFRSPVLAAYAVGITIAFHLRVVFFEEPWLRRMHGEQWNAYSAEVPRWLPFSRRPVSTTARGKSEGPASPPVVENSAGAPPRPSERIDWK
jgi:protein-S-isoprenylcysteine O-methyltransferase Ste14